MVEYEIFNLMVGGSNPLEPYKYIKYGYYFSTII